MSIEDSNWFGVFNTANVHNLTGRVDADHPEITLEKDATGAYRLTYTHIQGKNHLIYVSVDSFHQEPSKYTKPYQHTKQAIILMALLQSISMSKPALTFPSHLQVKG